MGHRSVQIKTDEKTEGQYSIYKTPNSELRTRNVEVKTKRGGYKMGRKISMAALREIQEEHDRWVSTVGSEGRCANLSEVNLRGIKLYNVNLNNADLSGADMRSANLSEVKLRGANLRGADMRNVYLWNGADLSEADLSEADLTRANLFNSNLTGARLSDVNLSGIKQKGANLSCADLSKANLTKARLSGAQGLTIEQLREAKTLYKSRLDPDLMKQVKEEYPWLLEKPKTEE